MTTAHVSDKGQITLPSDMRKEYGIKPKSYVTVEKRKDGIMIRPIRSVRDVRGMFREAAKKKNADWETVRTETERLVAEEVANEDR